MRIKGSGEEKDVRVNRQADKVVLLEIAGHVRIDE